jgi:hypothetical protein
MLIFKSKFGIEICNIQIIKLPHLQIKIITKQFCRYSIIFVGLIF